MTFPYLNDILHQPDALQDTLYSLNSAPSLSVFHSLLERNLYQRIVLTGMGSSYHALVPLYYRLIQANLNGLLIETSELIHHTPALIDKHTLLIVVSQSGRSAEVIRLLEQAKEILLTHAGEEASVSCKTYLTALAALEWLGDGILPTFPRRYPLLSAAPQLVTQYLNGWQGYIKQLKGFLINCTNMFLVGRGDSLAAVGTGGLIVKEAGHFPAEGMSSASFRHGPMEMLTSQVFVIVFQGEKEVAGLNQKLAKNIQAVGSQAGFVLESTSLDVFHIPPAPAPIRPILEILPVEMITLALADLQGREAGRFELGSKVTVVE